MSASPTLPSLVASMSLHWMLTDPAGFGLTTASPLQRAITRIADGRPVGVLGEDPTVVAALGGVLAVAQLPTVKPRELAILSGIRVGKSLMAGALAVHWSQICEVDNLGPGETPRVSIVSLTKDLADVVYGHVLGRLQSSPVLSRLVCGEPSSDSVMVRHPSGRPIEIKVVAGARAGSSLVARWSAGCIFDEFPRMISEADGVVNWEDSRNGVLLRLLPGAQLMHIGSPWAPSGPAYELVCEHWGHPTASMVVIKAPAPAMNPVYWTPDVVEQAKTEPDVYRTDVLAEFATAEEALFSVETLERAMRPEAGPEPGHVYSAAMDPATRGNSWTIGFFTRTGRTKRMVCARQVTGSRAEPLSPRDVFRDVIAPECRRYAVMSIETDQWYIDALQDIAREFGLSLTQTSLTDREKTERYMGVKARLELGEVELVPEVRVDLMRLRKRVTQNGVSVILPATSDGRHCDHAPTVMLGIGRYLRDVVNLAKVRVDPEVEAMRRATEKRFGRAKWED